MAISHYRGQGRPLARDASPLTALERDTLERLRELAAPLMAESFATIVHVMRTSRRCSNRLKAANKVLEIIALTSGIAPDRPATTSTVNNYIVASPDLLRAASDRARQLKQDAITASTVDAAIDDDTGSDAA